MSSAPGYAQKVIDNVIKDIPEAVAFMDDVLLASTLHRAWEVLENFLDKVDEAGLKIGIKKSRFMVTKTEFLGYSLEQGCYGLSAKHSEAMKRLRPPTDVPSMRSLIGQVSYFRFLIPDLQKRLAPFYRKLKKNYGPWRWENEDQETFESLKRDLTSEPVLGLALPHSKKELFCDASLKGLGSVLTQSFKENDESGKLTERTNCLGYASRVLTPSEQNYSISYLELASVAHALKVFRVFLFLEQFTLYVDSQVVSSWLKTPKQPPTKKISDLLAYIQTFNFTLVRCSTKEQIADYLSRFPDEKSPLLGQFPLEYEGDIYYDPKALTLEDVEKDYMYSFDADRDDIFESILLEDQLQSIHSYDNAVDDDVYTPNESLYMVETRRGTGARPKTQLATRSQPMRQAKAHHQFVNIPGQPKLRPTPAASQTPTPARQIMPPRKPKQRTPVTQTRQGSGRTEPTPARQLQQPSPIRTSTPFSRIPRLIGGALPSPSLQTTPRRKVSPTTSPVKLNKTGYRHQIPMTAASTTKQNYTQPVSQLVRQQQSFDAPVDPFLPDPRYMNIPPVNIVLPHGGTQDTKEKKPPENKITPLRKTLEKYYTKSGPIIQKSVNADPVNIDDFFVKESKLFPELEPLFTKAAVVQLGKTAERMIPQKVLRDVQQNLEHGFRTMFTRRQIIEAQKACPYLGYIWKYLTSGNVILSRNPRIAKWTQLESQFFACVSSVLFRLVEKFPSERTDDNPFHFALAIPGSLLPDLFQAVHGNLMTCHISASKMIAHLRPRYWSRFMSQKAQEFVKTCVVCITAKREKEKHSISSPVLGSFEPMKHIAWDCFTLPKSEENHVGCVTISCRSTRWLAAFPVHSFQATEVARCLAEWVIRYGAPVSAKSDRGPEFLASCYTILAENLGISLIYSNPHSPYSTSDEAMHKTLSSRLRKAILTGYPIEKWHKYIGSLVQGCNELPRVYGSSVTPFFLLHGFHKRTCLEATVPHELAENNDFFESWNTKMQKMALVRKMFHEHWTDKTTTANNLRIQPEDDLIQVNDIVLMYSPSGKYVLPWSRKASCPWDGTYRVVSMAGTHSAILQRMGDLSILKTPVSLSLLRKVPERPPHLQPTTTLSQAALDRLQKYHKGTIN